jgi:hypothetical protein
MLHSLNSYSCTSKSYKTEQKFLYIYVSVEMWHHKSTLDIACTFTLDIACTFRHFQAFLWCLSESIYVQYASNFQ